MLRPVDHVISGVRCAVHDSEPGRAEAVVFVHGSPGPLDDWEGLAEPAAALARVVAMDMPGYGRSARPRDFDYTVDGYARFLGDLLDQLQVDRAHLVLHDFGGAWGLRWGLDHPDRLASVTFINCGLLDGYRWHTFARIWQTPILGEIAQCATTAWGMQRALDRLNPKPMPRRFVERVLRYADWGHKRAVLKLYRASRHLGQTTLALPDVAKILPVCVIWGAEDPFIDVRFAAQQRRHFPAAQLHVLDGLGHWPFLDDLEAVRSPLIRFLEATLPGAPIS